MVDVDFSGGERNNSNSNSRRRMLEVPDSDCPEIVPLELYDSSRAKIAANLSWIFSKAYGIDNIPEDLRDAFYTDQYDQEHIKPPVIKLLLSSELYCRVCSLILKGDQVAALQGHQPVIHALSRKGIYVMESDDMPVSESDLTQSPIKMNAHMALIDALMMAYTVEMISIEKVVASVKRFSTFSASKELPYDLEDAMVFWINKVNLKMREITERELKLKQQLLESSSQQKVRYRRDHPLNKQLPFFPLMEDLMRDVCDGCSLLAIIHYYCPELMKLEDICLKEVTSIADSLYNIQLLIDFSHQYLNKCFYLTLEDMLYAPLVLKPNAMVFIAELFWWFEIVKPDFVQPRDVQEVKDAKSLLQQKSTRPPLPISNATKRSFMVSPANGPSDPQTPVPQITADIGIRYYLHPEEFVKGSPAFNTPHPLLPLRQRQYKSSLPGEESPDTRHRSNSLTRVDGQPRGSVLAWQEKKPRPLSQPTPFALHYATDGDPDVSSGDSISLARSISKDSLASNVINVTPKHQSQLMPPIRSNGKALLRNVDMEDEDDEELIAIIKSDEGLVNNSDLEIQSVLSRAASTSTLTSPKKQPNDLEAANQDDSFFLEPLMPAVLKPAKESLVLVNKREECGEEKHRSASARRTADGLLPSARKKASNANADADINRTFTPIVSSEFTESVEPDTVDPLQHSEASEASLSGFRPLLSSSIDTSAQGEAGGFFLHTGDPEEESASKPANGTKSTGTNKASATDTTWTLNMQDSDSEMLDMEEGEGDLPPEDEIHPVRSRYSGEEESSKLHYDMRVKEREDKEGASGRSSPCLSTISQTSSISLASTSVRMTNFAERKLQRLNSVETKSSTSSSQKSTPDGSECCPLPMITWRQRREKSPNRQIKGSAHLLASELVQLHMQLEEKRRAIEGQKKKMEALSARQRLKLGRAAFLHIVKKGKNEGIPKPLKPEHFLKESDRPNAEETVAIVSRGSRTDDALASQEDKDEYSKQMEGVETKDVNEKIIENDIQESIAAVRQRWLKDSLQPPYDVGKNKASPNGGLEDGLGDVDVNEYSRSIEKLNETLSNLQHEMHKLSQQQELLMKFKDQAPSTPSPDASCTPPDQKTKPITHLVESPMSMGGGPAQGARKQLRSTPAKNARSARPTDIKLSRDSKTQSTFRVITPTHSVEALTHLRPFTSSKVAKPETEAIASDDHVSTGASEASPDRVPAEQTTERRKDDAAVDVLCEEGNQRATVLSTSQKDSYNYFYQQINTEAVISTPKKTEHPSINSSDCSGKENIPVEEHSKNKANLIEVDISELNGPEDGEACENRGISTSQVISESEQKSGLGFFFKDDQKAEDELAKKRAAFLLKQQRKAEEARFRRQQLEAEIEQKRDEARRKAEEERVRKEEEKARRELIKQEYLRRKQQQILDEQGLGKPKPKTKKQRPRSVHREESSSEPPSRYPSTPDNLSSAQSGSSLSLASAATTEAESVNSGGGGSGGFSQRTDSMETFSVLSRNQSRNTERDWENTSTASSIASVAEYTGPKLFKEPSSKSNKPLIHNAVSHCCLAGKVNEPMKNSILEELERCEAHHYIILFRDAGCQFRAVYAYFPEAEEIQKLTGTGPKSITKKMIDKIYKYSSDRKQFNLIPSKTMSVSVDALTIHNHLWQAKRTGVPKKQTAAK